MSDQTPSATGADPTTPMPLGPTSDVERSALGSFAPPTRPRPSSPATGPAYLPPVPPPSSAWGSDPAPGSGTGALGTASRSSAGSSFAPNGPPGPPVGPGTPAAGSTGRRSGRWGWRALVAFIAGGLVAASGFAASQLTLDESEAAGPAPSTVMVEAGSTGGAAEALPPVEVDEPAAYVAQILGPSVVQVETDFGLGSGVVYADGLIMTNNHVVEGSNQQRVRLADGRTLSAEIVGTDPNTDIAVLSVDASDLPVAELALGEQTQVGQIAVAIGSPFQLQQSVTAGIVSAVDRPVPNRERTAVVAMIQTDAPINPGNSGGALADKQGRVIGINTAIQTDGLSGTNAGVGFAVPIETAVRIANLLVEGEPIESGFLGVTGVPPSDGSAGVEIASVEEGSAAEQAGIQVGDRVLSLDGAPVTAIDELAGLVLARQAGDEVMLKVVRDGQNLDVPAVLGLKPGGGD